MWAGGERNSILERREVAGPANIFLLPPSPRLQETQQFSVKKDGEALDGGPKTEAVCSCH